MEELIKFIGANWRTMLPLFSVFFGVLGFFAKRWYNDFRLSHFKITDHTLFINIKSSLREIRSWVIKENREVFRDMIDKKLLSWFDEGLKLAEELDKKTLSNQKLMKALTEFEDRTIEAYVSAWKEMKVPKEAITVFNERHQPKVDAFQIAIIQIVLNDAMYRTYKSKVIAVFNKLDTLLIETKLDLLTICTQEYFNGRFSGATYKTIPVSDEEFKQSKCLQS